ncbi:MAG: hydroxymethylglutaryl-CoA lyase [Candidatus Melainabacteria bacterium]|nr:hydroxymethylglutaryl-CoA lyase [Candidatus Melainabacteria bacterium]
MFEKLPTRVKIVEVGPRDGLQNEPNLVETDDKIRLIQALAEAGLSHIEVTSFVSPKWIPQLKDASEVAAGLAKLKLNGVTTSCLVPNLKGYERFKESKLDELALFMSATESHSKKNINKSVEEALATLKEVADVAKADGFRIRVYLSVVFECPYEGRVDSQQVLKVTEKLVAMGVDEVSLGDTIGAATPKDVFKMVEDVSRYVDKQKLALHFHDTRGTALANVVAGLEAGVTIFDASLGGLGGCPYAPGAAGNLATEDLVYMMHGLGVETGINLDKLVDAGALAQKLLDKPLPGRYLKAALAVRDKANATSNVC